MHVAALFHSRALRGQPPRGLGQRSGVVQVMLREGGLDGIRSLHGVVVGDGAVNLLLSIFVEVFGRIR